MPNDLVIGERLAADANHRVLDGVEVPEGWMGLDIGPKTVQRYAGVIASAGTVFWNGPMGAFELEPFAAGTRAVARGRGEREGPDGRGRRGLGCGAGAIRAGGRRWTTCPPVAARRWSWSRGGSCLA